MHPELTKFKLEKQARWVHFGLVIVPAPPVMLIFVSPFQVGKADKVSSLVHLYTCARYTVCLAAPPVLLTSVSPF